MIGTSCVSCQSVPMLAPDNYSTPIEARLVEADQLSPLLWHVAFGLQNFIAILIEINTRSDARA